MTTSPVAGSSPTPEPTPTPMSSLISYPSQDSLSASSSAPASSSKAPPSIQTMDDRLYIGGIHPSVDEVTLWKLLKDHNPYKIDFPVHSAGALQGRSRGFAFVHFQSKEDAAHALSSLNGQLLRKQTLTVSHAKYNAQMDLGPHRSMRRALHDPTKQTVLSKIKTRRQPSNTKSSIAMLEAKLNSMTRPSSDSSTSLQAHPSLPAKPPPSAPYLTHAAASKPTTTSAGKSSVGSPGSASASPLFGGGTPRTPSIPTQGASIFEASSPGLHQSRSSSTTPGGQVSPPTQLLRSPSTVSKPIVAPIPTPAKTGSLVSGSTSNPSTAAPQRRARPASVLTGVKMKKSRAE